MQKSDEFKQMTRRALIVGGMTAVASTTIAGQPQSIDITENIILNK